MCEMETVKLFLEEAKWDGEISRELQKGQCSNQTRRWLREPWEFLFWYGGNSQNFISKGKEQGKEMDGFMAEWEKYLVRNEVILSS